MFATVGSQFTTAAVVSYSLQKDKITKEDVPTVQVMGVGLVSNDVLFVNKRQFQFL